MPERSRQPPTLRSFAPRPVVEVLRSAARDPSQSLDTKVRRSLENRLDYDFGSIRVHSGAASKAAADRLGASAYALGRDIHLGAEALALTGPQRERLLAHEAVHTVQQGRVSVTPHERLSVSDPHDAAESEAARIADSVRGLPAPLSSGDRTRTSMRSNTIARMVAPQIQRDLTGQRKAIDGNFDLDLKAQAPPKPAGMLGTIKFRANEKAQDSKSIRLLQTVRTEDLGAGKDVVWSGDEANRNKVMTTADTPNEIASGFFVDHSAKMATPRNAKGDAAVSPYYRDYWPNSSVSQDGSKNGKTVKEASLADYPQSSTRIRFSFETAAKASDTGYIYASLVWGFTISDPAKGKIENEHAAINNVQSTTFDAAVKAFDEFYKNLGSSKAPK